MALDLATVQARITTLEEAIATGQLNVKFEDRSVTYRTVDDMFRVLQWLEGKRDGFLGVTQMRSRQIRTVTSDGF